MRRKQLLILVIFPILVLQVASASLAKGQKAEVFVGQDLHIAGQELISYQLSTGEHTLVLQNGFSMSIGANQFSSDSAVVWLESVAIEFRDRIRIDYKAIVYLQGNITARKAKGARTTDLSQTVLEKGQTMIVRFEVSGEVFVTADKRNVDDPRGLELYTKAIEACRAIGIEAKFVVEAPAGPPPRRVDAEMVAPELPAEEEKKILVPPVVGRSREEKEKEIVIGTPAVRHPVDYGEKPVKPEVLAAGKAFPTTAKTPAETSGGAGKEIRFRYPVNIAPMGEVSPQVEWDEEKGIGTVIGRFYLWQKQDERGGLLELQADNAVIFYLTPAKRGPKQGLGVGEPAAAGAQDILAKGAVSAIYLSGNVVMTEGQRTIRADEIYYDFERKKALAINAVMRNFDVSRGIPIYVRAAELKQLAENKFAADNITLTTSEFYLPQISLNASEVVITDTTSVDEQQGRTSDQSYDAQMRDVRLKMYDKTIFYWPFVHSNLQRPDIPLKTIRTSYDSTWGASVETRWYLARMLGLREPEGTDSTYALDYYGKRGVGTGAEIDYTRENYFGRLLGYVIQDTGDDDLGRYYERRNIKPPRELRGRFLWRHRHFLPYNWQLTTEVSYASDENFIESFYRSEFNVGKEQETLVHLKRIEDNWGLSFLGKVRINTFVNKLEELPTAEFHWTGQSFLDDKLTFYVDEQVSRLRQRYGSPSSLSEEFFTFMSERIEVDMPVTIGKTKVVPFVAGTTAFDDGMGFRTNIDGSPANSKIQAWFGEGGVRISPQSYWKVFPDVKSQLWDLNQLRHIISPYMTAVSYTESDSVIEQRDTLNVGISQRLQTKRGTGKKQRSVDWMRLDMDFTWVADSADASDSGPGPDRFIWNKPFIPVPKRRGSGIFGPRRKYFGADYIWRMSDTTALLSDMNFDMQSGVVQQFNIGFSHLRWPNLSYYIGSRYLKRLNNNLGEHGSNMFTFAATYALDPRYTLVFSQQYDFDYAASVRSEITLIRRYHRMYWALTYSADESLKRNAIAFSIWPQGVPEMAIGQRSYVGIASPAGY